MDTRCQIFSSVATQTLNAHLVSAVVEADELAIGVDLVDADGSCG